MICGVFIITVYTYIHEYKQVCICIGTDIHINANMKGVFAFTLVIV